MNVTVYIVNVTTDLFTSSNLAAAWAEAVACATLGPYLIAPPTVSFGLIYQVSSAPSSANEVSVQFTVVFQIPFNYSAPQYASSYANLEYYYGNLTTPLAISLKNGDFFTILNSICKSQSHRECFPLLTVNTVIVSLPSLSSPSPSQTPSGGSKAASSSLSVSQYSMWVGIGLGVAFCVLCSVGVGTVLILRHQKSSEDASLPDDISRDLYPNDGNRKISGESRLSTGRKSAGRLSFDDDGELVFKANEEEPEYDECVSSPKYDANGRMSQLFIAGPRDSTGGRVSSSRMRDSMTKLDDDMEEQMI